MIPRLAMINDIAGVGHCSSSVSLPVISAMQVQVCPVPTSILSNHLGFPSYYFDDYTPHMRDYLKVWRELGFTFDGLYCGFLGNSEQIRIVEEFLQDFQPQQFLLDPVMGDKGKRYNTIQEEHCDGLKRLLPHASLITPNITEACLLTGTPYKDGFWTDYELLSICEKLAALCPGRIVITGLYAEGYYLNYIWQNGVRTSCTAAKAGASRPGTGDLFASILAADMLRQVDLGVSVQKATDFIAKCTAASERDGIPIVQGVQFERFLKDLIP